MQRRSVKRDAILAAMRATKAHPSAQQLYDALRKDWPQLSLGTVYRDVAQLKNAGYIRTVCTVNGQERYDANVEDHIHFVCEECAGVTDLPGEVLSDELCRSLEECGLSVHSADLTLKGVCSGCQSAAVIDQ